MLADVKGEGAVNHIRITNSAVTVRQLLMRIYFDGQTSPAVDVPLSDFFSNADCSEYRRISSMVICCNPRKGFNSCFEMPYFKAFASNSKISERPTRAYITGSTASKRKYSPTASTMCTRRCRRQTSLKYYKKTAV